MTGISDLYTYIDDLY